MWDNSDKYSVFMLLWLIAGSVITGGWFPIVAYVFSGIYALMAVYASFKGE